jgi:hypothetical protein
MAGLDANASRGPNVASTTTLGHLMNASLEESLLGIACESWLRIEEQIHPATMALLPCRGRRRHR